jgi:hypothetical protein
MLTSEWSPFALLAGCVRQNQTGKILFEGKSRKEVLSETAGIPESVKKSIRESSGDVPSQRQGELTQALIAVVQDKGLPDKESAALKSSLTNLPTVTSVSSQPEALLVALIDEAQNLSLPEAITAELAFASVDALAEKSSEAYPIEAYSLQSIAIEKLKDSGVQETIILETYVGRVSAEQRDSVGEVDALLNSPLFSSFSRVLLDQKRTDLYGSSLPSPTLSNLPNLSDSPVVVGNLETASIVLAQAASNSPLVYLATEAPKKGSLGPWPSDARNGGTVVYTPDGVSTGADSFTYIICHSVAVPASSCSAPTTVTLNLVQSNQPPQSGSNEPSLCDTTPIPDNPTLDLNFAQTKSLDSQITFSRPEVPGSTATATYVDSSGTIRTAAFNEPRFNHDPITGDSLGLLIEPTRANLALGNTESTEGDNGMTDAQNVMMAPDGTMTADKLIERTAGNIGGNSKSLEFVSPEVGMPFTISTFAKAGERTQFGLDAWSDGGSGPVYDLSNGTILIQPTPTGSSAKIEPYKNGWYRCSYTYMVPPTFDPQSRWHNIVFYKDGTTEYTTDGTSGIYFWGHQAEVSTFATSYIKGTTISGNKRIAADSVTIIDGANLDSFSRASAATYVGLDGLLKTAAINEPRYFINPSSLGGSGLIVEPSMLVGGRFQVGGHNLTGTANVAGVIAPDGTETAFRAEVIANGGGYQTVGETSAVASNGHMITMSVFAKAGEVGKFTLVGGAEPSSKSAIFDVTNGTIAVYPTHPNSSASIQKFPNGWYRCSTTFLRETATTNYFFFWLPMTNVGGSNDWEWLAGQGMYFWGINIALDATAPTSHFYSSTGHISLNRSADVVSTSGTDFSRWYNRDKGTLISKVKLNGFTGTSQTHYEFSDNKNDSNRIGAITKVGSKETNYVGASDILASAVSSAPILTDLQINAFRIDSTELAASVNGAPPASFPTNVSIPTSTQLTIGNNFHGNGSLNGNLLRLVYYPTKLTDNELMCITK